MGYKMKQKTENKMTEAEAEYNRDVMTEAIGEAITEAEAETEIREATSEAEYQKTINQAEAQRNRIYKTLNESIKFSIDVSNSDDITLNNIGLNDDVKSVNRLSVVMDSTEAKKQINSKYGFSVDKWVNRTENLNPEIRILARNKISNRFRKIAKNLLYN